MTSVDSPAEVSEPQDLEGHYRRDRARLYQALVLTFTNRDIAVEAIDRAYAKWQSRRSKRRAAEPDVQIFGAAYSWAHRKLQSPDRAMQGFRLPGDDLADDDERALGAFDYLDATDRALLVCRHFLGWDSQATAAALDLPEGEISPRTEAATSRYARAADLDLDEAVITLHGALAARAATLPEPLSRVDSVRAKARVRRIGIIAGASLAGLALAAGVGLGVQQILESDPATTDPSGPVASPNGTSSAGTNGAPGSGATQAPGGPVSALLTADGIEWNKVAVPIREGEVNSVAFGPTGFVAIGMDWSGAQQSLTLLSEDGITWDVAPGPLQTRNGWIGQMVVTGDRYVAVGNTYDDIRGTDSPLVVMSTDGFEWIPAQLPFEPEIEVAGQLVRVYTNVQQVTAQGDTTIVFGMQHLEFDPMELVRDALPDGVILDNYGWSGRGVELYDRNGNLEQVIPWEELGLDEETISLVTSGRPLLWTSDDFETWDIEVMSGFGPDAWVSAMAATEDALVAVVGGQFGQGLWTSSDGSEWTRAEVGDRGASVTSVSSTGDLLIAAGSDATGQGAVWTSSDGTDWEQHELPVDSIGWIDRVHVGSNGYAILAQVNQPQQNAGPAEIFVDDLTVEVSQNGAFTILDADGNELAVVYGEEATYEGDSIVLPDPETGEVLVTFTQQELNAAWDNVWRTFEEVARPQGPDYVLLLSGDGVEWTAFEIADQITDFYPNAVALGDEAIVLTGWSDGGFEGGGQAMWVGTAQ